MVLIVHHILALLTMFFFLLIINWSNPISFVNDNNYWKIVEIAETID